MSHSYADRPIYALIAERCALLGRSPRTVEGYAGRLIGFEDWIGGSALDATQAQAAAWQAACAADGASRHALYHNRCALAFFWREFRGRRLDRRILPALRRPDPPVPTLPGPQMLARLLSAIADERIRVFCQFIYATGLRLDEALAVRVRDLDLPGRAIIVTKGKGARVRRSILPAGIIALLAPLLRRHDPDALVFTDASGRPLNPERLNANLRSARWRVGLHTPCTLHHLRHCFATHLHERGAGLIELQRLLGHSTPLLTMLYIGLREDRRAELAEIGDLIAALPPPQQEQQRITFGG